MTGALAAAPADTGRLRRLAVAVGALAGWRRWALAAAFGVLAAAGMPPVYAFPALPVAFTVLLWLIDGSRSVRSAFAAGWWFGFGHFVAGLYWVSHALLIEPEKFAWLIPFAVSCLPAYLALFSGAVAGLVHRMRVRGVTRILVFAAAWAAMEWLRGGLMTGFPWNTLALSLAFSEPAMQGAAWLGAYGLGFVVAFVCAAPATLGETHLRRPWVAPAIAAALALAVYGGGAVRLAGAQSDSVTGIVIRIVQGNLAQQIKWEPALRDRHLAHYMQLSRAPAGAAGPPTHIIWPETAVPVVFTADDARSRAAASVVPAGGLLITGAIRVTPPDVRPFEAWNSLHAIDPAGRIVATYDKFHLVPFGEYVPLRPLLGALGLEAVAAERADFSAGPGPRTLDLPGLPPASPLICYEAIFSGDVVDPARRPGWLLNVTNDAWFGVSAGPHQHFASARLRAVEEGLPLVRAANTGISAVIDPYGRVLNRLGLDRIGVVDARLPRPLPPTWFGRIGHWPLGALLLLAGVAILLQRRASTPPG